MWGGGCFCGGGGGVGFLKILNLSCVNCAEVLQKHKWEDANTVDKSAWTYRRNVKLSDLHTVEELLAILVQTVRYGDTLVEIASVLLPKSYMQGLWYNHLTNKVWESSAPHSVVVSALKCRLEALRFKSCQSCGIFFKLWPLPMQSWECCGPSGKAWTTQVNFIHFTDLSLRLFWLLDQQCRFLNKGR